MKLLFLYFILNSYYFHIYDRPYYYYMTFIYICILFKLNYHICIYIVSLNACFGTSHKNTKQTKNALILELFHTSKPYL